MINISSVIKELSALMKTDEQEAAKYSSIAENAVKSVEQLLKDDESTDDNRVIHLCAVKTFYHIVLSEKDDICSFSAGDISYSKDSSAADNAEKLLNDALNSCSTLLRSTGFAFKVV